MVRRPAIAFALAVVAAAVLAPRADAEQNRQNADIAWKLADKCGQDAIKKYPDYTPESNAKREVARRACLRNHKLPVPSAASQATAPGGDGQ